MFMKNFGINVLRHMDFSLFIGTRISMTGMFKKTKVKLELLTDVNMLLMIEDGIGRGMYHSIHK